MTDSRTGRAIRAVELAACAEDNLNETGPGSCDTDVLRRAQVEALTSIALSLSVLAEQAATVPDDEHEDCP